MIFLGDIAHPFTSAPNWGSLDRLTDGQPVVVNLEGAIVNTTVHLPDRKLFNHVSVIDALAGVGAKVVCLANNHITDVEQGVEITRQILAENSMMGVGAGTPSEAASPVFLNYNGHEYAFVAFGWSTIQCVPARPSMAGVNPLTPDAVLKTIAKVRRERPRAVIVAMFHWNMELERYPQPAHRQLAFAAIDEGADAIIGHHPHCVGGFEIYRGCPIVYSLGDWWIPHGVFLDGQLSFPDYTLRQVAFEWEYGKQSVLHWFDYSRDTHEISYDSSEVLGEGVGVPHHTPFSGLSAAEYKTWFRRNRVKRNALPIYYDYRSITANLLRDAYVRGRQPFVVAARKVFGRT